MRRLIDAGVNLQRTVAVDLDSAGTHDFTRDLVLGAENHHVRILVQRIGLPELRRQQGQMVPICGGPQLAHPRQVGGVVDHAHGESEKLALRALVRLILFGLGELDGSADLLDFHDGPFLLNPNQ